MQSLYDNTKKSRLTNTTKENNQYYETINKTSQNDEKFKKDLLNVYGNFTEIALDCIEKQKNRIEQLKQERQQLISFLKDEIKNKNKTLEMLEGTGSIRISILQSQLKTLQEVLDFVKGNEKND